MSFPADKDLSPGDVMVALVVGAEVPPDDSPVLVDGVRQAFRETAAQRGFSGACDVILMAVPIGKAQPFVDGLMESIANDEGGEVLR